MYAGDDKQHKAWAKVSTKKVRAEPDQAPWRPAGSAGALPVVCNPLDSRPPLPLPLPLPAPPSPPQGAAVGLRSKLEAGKLLHSAAATYSTTGGCTVSVKSKFRHARSTRRGAPAPAPAAACMPLLVIRVSPPRQALHPYLALTISLVVSPLSFHSLPQRRPQDEDDIRAEGRRAAGRRCAALHRSAVEAAASRAEEEQLRRPSAFSTRVVEPQTDRGSTVRVRALRLIACRPGACAPLQPSTRPSRSTAATARRLSLWGCPSR